MRRLRIISVALITFFVAGNALAQKNFAMEADNSFKALNYYSAIKLYKKAYVKVKKNRAERNRILFQIAECYRMTNDSRRAEPAYKRLVRIKYPNPKVTLYYADALKANGNYEDALIEYQNYAEKVPNDRRGLVGVESCRLAQTWMDNPTRWEVENMKKWNSRDRDFSTAYADRKYKTVVFTSAREGSMGRGYDPWTGQSFMDLYIVTLDRRGNWSAPVLLDEEMVNTNFSEGTACFNKKASVIFFTRCRYDKKEKYGCEIYMAQRRGRGWGESEVVPLTPDSFSVGHPSLSENELELYFASDMPGGFGGKDIWVAKRTRKNKPFDPPVNLGPKINTPGDEMFPFLRADGTLYFSSDGHPGMGGLDVFKAELTGDSVGTPENMKAPINSAADDFGLILKADENTGFVSSNRKGGRGDDDIYSVYLPPLVYTLAGVVRDDSTLQLLEGVNVKLVGTDGTNLEIKTDKAGYYQFDKTQILPNTSYDLYFSKQGYLNNEGFETTVGLDNSKDIIHDKGLAPIPKEPILLPEILYELARWDLLPQYQDSLNDLLETMNKNPRIVIELASHTDARATDAYNDTLSFKRAKSVVDYLTSKGVARDRMVPKGYGERIPRTLKKDIVRDGIVFPAGTTLTEEYIASLPNSKTKEAAHQLNRRTEFSILRDDYIPAPSNDSLLGTDLGIQINPADKEIPINMMENGAFDGKCIVIGTQMDFEFWPRETRLKISADEATMFLQAAKINKNDFKLKDKAIKADGSIVENAVLVLKELRIGPMKITNVEAVVTYDQEAPIIFGETILKKFGAYSLNTEDGLLIFK